MHLSQTMPTSLGPYFDDEMCVRSVQLGHDDAASQFVNINTADRERPRTGSLGQALVKMLASPLSNPKRAVKRVLTASTFAVVAIFVAWLVDRADGLETHIANFSNQWWLW